MEFWGAEVSFGKPLHVVPTEDTYLHVSQAALGPSKDNKSERVVIRVETDGKNIVLGTLVPGKVDQMALDLIFDREFTLLHNSTSSSVFFCGYRTEKGAEEDFSSDEEFQEEEEDDEEAVPAAVPIKENGTVSVIKEAAKDVSKEAKETTKESAKATKKAKVNVDAVESVITETKVVKAKSKKSPLPKAAVIDQQATEDDGSDDDDDEDDEDDDDEDDEEDDEGDEDAESGSDDEDDEDSDDEEDDDDEGDDGSEDDEEEEDAAPELGKKRLLKVPDQKSAPVGKKPRVDTPAKPGLISSTPVKKNLAKVAPLAKLTPVASNKKSQAKTPTSTTKTPLKTPAKEGLTKTPSSTTPATTPGGDSAKKLGEYHCAECKRNFATESGLTQHSAAKHKK